VCVFVNLGSNPGRGNKFSGPRAIRTALGAQPAPYPLRTFGCFLGDGGVE
jgi:hypothetical protein